MPAGRPTKYKHEYADQAYRLCLLKATDEEMADFFGIRASTFNRWKKDHPEFWESITRGKLQADAEVAEKLRERALGYSHPECIIYQGVVTGEVTKHYPPDTQAASLWLRNRQPGKWRDKQDHEHSGPDGGPIKTESITFVGVGKDSD